jgi:HEAT repeat protein
MAVYNGADPTMPTSAETGGQNTIAGHIAALQADEWKTRWQAAQTLGELGDRRAIPALLASLGDGNQWVRIVAAEALGQIGDREATHSLMLALADDSVWVRRACVVALGQIGDERAIPPLVNRLLDPPNNEWPEELRDAIAKALGGIGEPALQTLVIALDDPDPWVNCAAARALGRVGDPSAISALSDMTNSEHGAVRSAATQALAQMADVRAVRAALSSNEAPSTFWKLMALKEIDKTTLDQLQGMLDDPDEHIRTQAAEVLNRLSETVSVDPLAYALQAKAGAVSTRSAADRGKIPEATLPRATARPTTSEKHNGISPLLRALKDPVAEVRLAAAEALGRLGDASVIPALSQALADPESRVRAAAARSLGEVGTKQ